MPEIIPSPYNFAPVWEKVFFYHQAEQAQDGRERRIPGQDIPFKDGLSGYIDVTLKATTPIYVRAEGYHNPEEIKALREALNRANGDVSRLTDREKAVLLAWSAFYTLPDGGEALPATTVKGMIRNVLEIATFSKMSAVLNDRYAVRDLRTDDQTIYKSWMTETTTAGHGGAAFRSKPQAAWMVQRGEDWFLQPCEHGRVEHSVLRTLARTGNNSPWERTFRDRNGNHRTVDECQSGKMYAAWAQNVCRNHPHVIRDEATFVKAALDVVTDHPSHGAPGRLIFREVSSISFATSGTHRLVFTGRIRNGNKRREFVFATFNPNGPLRRVPDGRELPDLGEEPDVRGDFEFIHQESPDWQNFWEPKLRDGEPVPVFYLAFDRAPDSQTPSVEFNGTNYLHSIGLSQMYRLAYRYRVRELLPPEHHQPDLDIAEAIFGKVGKRGDSLRGRVQCEPFPAMDHVERCGGDFYVLNSPKPTFYPNYVEQKTNHSGETLASGATYNTFQTPPPQGRIRGWKRYPVRQDSSLQAPIPNPPPNSNYRVVTAFKPLAAGATFSGHVHFHNLCPWELGALLWALRFGWQGSLEASPYRHSVGMGKPLGCGGVELTKLDVHAIDVLSNPVAEDQSVWINAFEKKVDDWLAANPVGPNPPTKIKDAEPIIQMRAMASQQERRDANLLVYPGNVREFGEYKSRNRVLPRYTQLPR